MFSLSIRRLLASSALLLSAGTAGAAEPSPEAPPAVPAAMPSGPAMSLDQALATFRERGFDLLLAEAQVRGAEADAVTARAVANPVLSASYSRSFNYDPTDTAASPCKGCSADGFAAAISDQGVLSNLVSGKRGLRVRAADLAVDVARMARVDAARVLERQVKQSYTQLLSAAAALDFAVEVRAFLAIQLGLSRVRYPSVINEGQLARVEAEKLDADQAVDAAANELRKAQVGFGYLLGERGAFRPVALDRAVLAYRLPAALATATPDSLLRAAVERRPDLRAAALSSERADAAIAAARRSVFPDLALGVQYAQTGTGQTAIQPPTLTVSVAAPIPVLYQQRGEVRRAEAERAAAGIQRARLEAQVSADVSAAWSDFTTARRLVERMESLMLDRARKARDITQLQFNAGSATLMDFLDAQRTFVSVNVQHFQLLADYWAAVFELEHAVGAELRS